MSDYIDRAALGIGSCNRDVFENKSYADGWNAAVKILKEAPAVDVRKVRRSEWKLCYEDWREHIAAEKIPHCKDCKNFVYAETYSYCEEYGGFVKESDYCSRIEIKAKRGEGRQ